MPDRFFNDWSTLVSAVDKTIPKILKKDVAPVAEDILKKHIKEDIYEAYKPKEYAWIGRTTYERRHTLYNVISIVGTNRGEHELTVTNNATPSPAIIKGYSFHNRRPGSFLQLIEGDRHGIWTSGFPRPAVAKAQEEIDNSSNIVNAIMNGLKREIGNSISIVP